MKKKLPVFMEGPETQTMVVSIIYSVLCFFSLPFFLLLFMQGLQDNVKVVSWFEIVFHIVTFLVTLGVFREFLTDNWDTFRINWPEIRHFVMIATGIVLGITLVYYMAYVFVKTDVLYLFGYGTLPISEMNLFMLPSELTVVNPIFGTLCLVGLVPLSTCCLYYAVGFPKAQNVNPWLGYLVVAVLIALPRIANAVTFWIPSQQMILYLAQLPVHMLACWCYRKTDTIFAPMLVHMAANLATCLLLIFTYLL